jgi:hypothetical protein
LGDYKAGRVDATDGTTQEIEIRQSEIPEYALP